MSTRGIYGFRKNNIDKVTFCHGDSYLEDLGNEMVNFIKDTSIETMNKIFDKIILVGLLDEATKEQIKQCKKYSNLEVNIRSLKDFTCLLYNTFGSLDVYRDEELKYMIDASKEITNIYLCEYAYIINLDTNEFEIYAPMYYKVIEDRYNSEDNEGETKCRLIKKYKLDNIPNNWIKECEKIDEEDWIKKGDKDYE